MEVTTEAHTQSVVFEFSGAAVTKVPQTGGLNKRNLFSTSSGHQKSGDEESRLSKRKWLPSGRIGKLAE